MSIGLIVFTGCSKDETNEQNVQESINSTYVLNVANGSAAWESVSTEEQSTNLEANSTNRSTRITVLGRMGAFGLPTNFSGRLNNGRVNGSGLLQLAGPGGSAARFALKATSIVSIGEGEVVYGALITNVIENTIPPPPPCPTFPNCPPPPFAEGSYVYFAVKDNGQGSDQYKGLIFPSSNALGDGGASFPWFIFPWNNLSSEDRIHVVD